MWPLTNKLNEGIIRNNRNGRILKISCLISFFWHICLFSIVHVTFPDIKIPTANKEIMFLGSYLDSYDLFPGEDKVFQKSIYFDTALENVLGQDWGDHPKLDVFLEKPKKYSFAQVGHIEEASYRPYVDSLQADVVLYSAAHKKELDLFDSKRIPDMHIYFKEGIPRPVKFRVYISDKGRVKSLRKTISSGSFDADMFIQRMLRRLVFDTTTLGRANWHLLELDLKNDIN